MAKRGEIAVELRLSDKKLKADIAAAMSKLKQDVAKMTVTSSGGMLTMGKESEKSSAAIDKQTTKVKRLTDALKDNKKAQLEAWRAANPGGVAAGQKITMGDDPTKASTKFSKWYAGQTVPYTGKGLAITTNDIKKQLSLPPDIEGVKRYGMSDLKARGLSSPALPKIEIPKFEQKKQSATEIATPFIERRLGLYGITPALKGLGILGIAAIGVGVAFSLMKKAMEEFTKATENARRLYAKNVSSGGLGQGYVTQRDLLSRVIGISEDEVMQYAGTFGYLNERLSIANRILVETNPTLTATAFNFSILKIDVESLASLLANDAAPAINIFVISIDALVKRVSSFLDSPIGKIIMGTGIGALSAIMGASLGPIMEKDLNKGMFSAPGIGSNPNRMPMSQWEKMGLVIGQIGGKNPQEETAKNTKKLVELFQQIKGGKLPRGMAFSDPSYSQP